MSRLLLLVVFFVWMAWGEAAPTTMMIVSPLAGVGLFLGVFAAIVLCMGYWGRRTAGRMSDDGACHDISRFHLGLDVARIAICLWYAAGVLALGWPRILDGAVGPFARWGIHLPGLIFGSAPALAAWSGLWWAQYPIERAVREQDLEPRLSQKEPGPIQRGFPTLWTYFQLQLRMQVLMTVAPLLLVLAVHDLLTLIVHLLPIRVDSDWLELGFSLVSVVSVLIWGPELLRRVVKTRPLANGALRRRLVAMAERCHIGYRDILLWDTGGQVANAMVMGMRARLRYVIISDLLIETLSDQQIEAVFAHELGHVRHRHLLRLALFMGMLMLLLMGPATTFRSVLGHAGLPDGLWMDATCWLVCGGAFFAMFGYVLRRFERQADLFAARTLVSRQVAVMPAATSRPSRAARSTQPGMPLAALAAALFESPSGFPPGALTLADSGGLSDPGQVLFSESSLSIDLSPTANGVITQSGAAIMSNALRRTALVNNLPVSARSWCHGSIAKRIAFLNRSDRDGHIAADFDRQMTHLNAALLATGIAAGVWTAALVIFGG
jgi:Zn-dependent protease with chaperone function